MEFNEVKQKIVIRTADRVEFVKEILKWGAMGAKLQDRTVPRLIAPFTAEMVVMINPKTPFRDSHCIRAYPPDHRVYTEQELTDMVFEEFRESVALFGVRGRDRKIMTKDYLDVIRKMQLNGDI